MGFWDWLRQPLVTVTVQERPTPDVRDVPHSPEEVLDPGTFDEYVNQREAKTLLKVEVEAARRTGHPMAHVLLYGPPGVGKTAMAHVLARETGALLYPSSGAEFSAQREILLAFSRIGKWHESTGRAVLWLIDEIDAIPRVATYVLHSLMSHGYVTLGGERFGLVPLSIVGTTNHMALVPAALKDRFQVQAKLDYYEHGDLALIAGQAARRMGIRLSEEAAEFIGLNAGGEPRKVTRRVLTSVANLLGGGEFADAAVAERALALSGLRPGGLSKDQVGYLEFLASSKNGTASLGSLAAYLTEPRRDVEGEVEPFLIRNRVVVIAPGGRTITDVGREYLQHSKDYANVTG